MMTVHEEFKRHRRWELGRAAEASILLIITGRNLSISGIENFDAEEIARFLRQTDSPSLAQHRRCGRSNLFRLRAISLSDAEQNPVKARHVVAIIRREVSSAIERNTFRREKHG